MCSRVCTMMCGSAMALCFMVGYDAALRAESVVTIAVDKDTYIDSNPSYDCNHGAMTSSLKAVLNSPSDGTKTRILLQLPTDTWTTPAGMELESLRLYMYCTQTISDSFAARLYPLTHSFVEGTGTSKSGSNKTGATWTTYDGTSLWTTAGGDFDATKYVDAVRASNGRAIATDNWAYWDLTSLAGDAALQTYGAIITVAPEDANLITNGYETKAFNSSDYGTASLRPYVKLTYTAVPEPAAGTMLFILTAAMTSLGWFWFRSKHCNIDKAISPGNRAPAGRPCCTAFLRLNRRRRTASQ